MKKILMAAAIFAFLPAASALPQPSCLELIRVWSFKALSNKTLIVEDIGHQKFKLTLMGYCPDLPYKQRLGLKVFGGTELSCISRGDEVISRAYSSWLPWHCPIVDIVPYTPAMEKADKAAATANAQQPGY
jgi:hypothetical protein